MKKYIIRRVVTVLLALVCFCFICSCDKNDKTELGKDVLRVMTYNVMHPEWSGGEEAVPVRNRVGDAADIIGGYAPDVIGLQEATEQWQKRLLKKLSNHGKYERVCYEKDGSPILTCFLYNSEKLTVVESSVTHLMENSDTRVFSFVVFEKNDDKSRFAVANTHLPPVSHGEVFTENCEAVMVLCGEIAEKYSDMPFVFLGDFNSGDDSEFYERMTADGTFSDARHTAAERVGSYGTFLEGGYGGRINKKESFCLDHIFVSSGVKTQRFFVVTEKNVKNVSDHLPVVADILLEMRTLSDENGEG